MNASSDAAGAGSTRTYRAFISYSHAADDRLAPALQSGLHRFAKPWYRLRAMRVFRDRTGLAVTPELWGSIRKALADSDYLILLASPDAARSQWVEQELDWWLQNRSASRLLIVVTDGELTWDRTAGDFDWSTTTALPRRLQKAFQEEPRYLDMRFARSSEHLSLRHPKFLDAVAALSATLQGRSLDELVGEDVSRHRQAMRLLRFAALGSLMLIVAAGSAVFLARQANLTARKVEADRERTAQQQQREALSREVAERSLAALGSDRDLATLLAIEAACAHPGADAASALRRSLFESRRPDRVLAGHPGGAYFATFTPDGRRLITGGADKTARVWEVDSGELVLELKGHGGGVTDADVTADGTRICTSSRDDGTARVWDAASGKALFEIGHEKLSAARFSPDGKLILTVAYQQDAVLWDASSGQRLRSLASAEAQRRGQGASVVAGAVFSPDGSRVALLDWGPGVNDVATGKPLFELEGHSGQVHDIAYSPDGQRLVTGGSDRTARLWRASTGDALAVLPHEAEVFMASFDPSGRWIVTGAADRVVRVWDVASQEKVAEIDLGSKELAGYAMSADGELLVTWSDGLDSDVFETRTGSRVAELVGRAGVVGSAEFSPDGRHIATSGFDGEVRLYAFALGGAVRQLIELARQRVPRALTALERERYLPEPFSQGLGRCP